MKRCLICKRRLWFRSVCKPCRQNFENGGLINTDYNPEESIQRMQMIYGPPSAFGKRDTLRWNEGAAPNEGEGDNSNSSGEEIV